MDQSTIIITLLSLILICATTALAKKDREVDIYSFHINSTVTSRYAITVITSRVANRLNESKEVHFEVKIPKHAFISKFRMTIEGKTYDGVVKKKEEAQQQYSEAVSRGESAGLVSSVGRTLEEFKTSVTVAAFSKVTFELTYEELLKRRLGKYELLINAQPMQPVADFKIDVYVYESPGISFLEVKGGLSTNELANAVTTTRSKNIVWVNFYPTREQQTKCEGCGENGLNGDLLILYDVERPESKGELQVLNGYFVHYFAPTNVQRIPKNVVFVIDISSSMAGKKIEQTRLALLKILGDLSEDDYFGLLTFDHRVEVWKSELLQATEGNVNEAKSFVRNMRDRGSTNINEALLKGVDMIKRFPREGTASVVILLTDGNPTSGETRIETIQTNVKKAIGGKFPLYCLGFGFDVQFTFLEKMALENNGAARRIYEDSDADIQLQGFYEEVATPLLTDVQMNYIGGGNLTQSTFSQYYNGSEIVVAGQITDNSLETFQTEVVAISTGSSVTYQDSVSLRDVIEVLPQHENFIERLWAFLTVKQLLGKELTLNGNEKEKAKKEAVDLSLKYNFVTPYTSLVVTKPQKEETQVSDKPIEMKQRDSNVRLRTLGGSANKLVNTIASGPPPRKAKGLRRISNFSHVINSVKRKPTRVSTSAPPVSHVRFMIAAQDEPIPICYDVPVDLKLNLLSDPLTGFSMNGQLSQKGFTQIVLHFNKNQSLSVMTNNINFYDGSNHVTFQWDQDNAKHETDSESLILRQNELDVNIGNVHVVFIQHKQDQDVFLWPAVRQKPNNVDMKGILGKNVLQYEQLPGSVVKINDRTENATWSSVVNLQLPSTNTLKCWLVSFQFALQGELSDYTVSQL